MVDMVNDLAQVFKSLNQLVIDQGTILDRIDYNIDSTVANVKKANVQLRKVIKCSIHHRLMSTKIHQWQKGV